MRMRWKPQHAPSALPALCASILMVGDSVSRYQYMSLLSYIALGSPPVFRSRPAWYPAHHGIKHGMVSHTASDHTAWYPTSAWYPARHGVALVSGEWPAPMGGTDELSVCVEGEWWARYSKTGWNEYFRQTSSRLGERCAPSRAWRARRSCVG